MGVGLSAIHGYTAGIFIGPIGRDFGWGAEKVLLGQALISVLVGFGAPIAGRLLDRIGARPLALSGTVIIAAGTAAIGFVGPSPAAYLGCFAAVAIGIMLASAITWQRPVAEQFQAGRGLALSLVLCGSNVAGALAPLIATFSIERWGWQAAYAILGGYMLVSALPLGWLFFRQAPAEELDQHPSNVAEPEMASEQLPDNLLETREFWLFCASFALAGMGITGYLTFLVPMLTALGFSLLLAASAVSTLSLAAIAGRIVAGLFLDHVFAPWLAALALALPVIGSLAVLTLPAGYAVALFAAILVGFSTGAEFNMISYLTVRYFGLQRYGSVGGIFYGVFTLGCLGGQQIPPLILMRGSYSDVIALLGGCFAVASGLMLFARSYPAAR
ncbi:MFS transporter [Novosphingobium sp. PASSN1]|uniref:MFS transporter n=1 Tax=Novosphingobium sp. PASSN1 TaxID=2015561 RepID=UPI0025E250BC|nr:MFS transporter [Novosphingobium sp. PASSN1]